MPSTIIDFDAKKGIDLFRAMWDVTEDVQQVRDRQSERDYQLFHAFTDYNYKNPQRFNISIPKMYSIINTKMPTEIRAILGKFPYIPFESKREEFKDQAELSGDLFDFYLKEGGFELAYVTADIMKILYGYSYIELIPTLIDISQKVAIPQFVDTIDGLVELPPKFKRQKIRRFRLNVNVLAPWEVRVDRSAVGLEREQDCRGIIKIRSTSKREIIRRAEAGEFGEKFDVDKLRSDKSDFGGMEADKNRGADILRSMGYPTPTPDGDMGILFEYESPERYIKVWNDFVELSDDSNPFDKELGGHGLINCSRLVHNVDPHTGASFYGNGEGKINEPLIHVLNDTVAMTFENNNMLNQGKTYYAEGRGLSPEQLVHAMGNKIPVRLEPNERIQDLILDDYGQPLSPDFYNLQALAEGWIDDTANAHPPSRGKSAPGNQTLGEVGFLIEGDEAPIELNVKMHEWITLPDIAVKGLAHIEQFTRTEDVIEVLGEEDASILLYKNPADLPGGYNYGFKASDKVVNQQIRQRNLVNLDTRIRGGESINEAELNTLLLEEHDLGDAVEKIIKPPEEILQDRQRALVESGAATLGGDKNTDIAQESGRAAAGI